MIVGNLTTQRDGGVVGNLTSRRTHPMLKLRHGFGGPGDLDHQAAWTRKLARDLCPVGYTCSLTVPTTRRFTRPSDSVLPRHLSYQRILKYSVLATFKEDSQLPPHVLVRSSYSLFTVTISTWELGTVLQTTDKPNSKICPCQSYR